MTNRFDLNDRTKISVAGCGCFDSARMTWAEFCRDNASDPEMIADAAEDLREYGRASIGGGAMASFDLTHEDWEPSDDQIMNGPGIEGGICYPIGGVS